MSDAAELRAKSRDFARQSAEAVIAAVRAGVPIKDCGPPYGAAYAIVRQYEADTGERLPRSKRGRKDWPRSERDDAIVAAYKETPNLRAVGKTFGISGERVRQIVVRHERQTGEGVERGKQRSGFRVARVLWCCPGCGEERTVLPSVARQMRACRRCANRAQSTRLTDAVIKDAIAKKLAGGKWFPIALAAGYPSNSSFQLPRSVYTALQHQGRHDTIAQLWPRGIPHWLQRFTLKPRRTA